jgi:restriction system protein
VGIPDFQSLMLPLLVFAGDGKEHSLREAIEALANQFNLTLEERKELLPSGRQATFDNRVGWSRTYMKKAGLLDSPRRSYFQITQRGLDVLAKNPTYINISYLRQFPEFIEFQLGQNKESIVSITTEDSELITPEESIESAYQRARTGLAVELLQTIKECSPEFFERLVVDLLVRMGYGGTRKDAGRAIGKSGDGGIDGIINEDRLGLDVVYIQAKRWDSTSVGRPEIQKFAGALQGQRARKGIFLTTSTFSKDAYDFASRIDSKIVLMDGETISQLMIDYGVGVTTVATYELKRIDSDYFSEE